MTTNFDETNKNGGLVPMVKSAQSNPRFVGKYVTEMRRVLEISALAGENAIIISPPGYGKTEIALTLAEAMTGTEGTLMIELDPSTPPEVIRGAYDPSALLDGRLERVIAGTPYDPSKNIVILDELWRASDIMFDALIHATNQKRRGIYKPVMWGTSNFVGAKERTEALKDRFALWMYPTMTLDVRGIVSSHRTNGFNASVWDSPIPWDYILEIRNAEITQKSADVISDMLETLTGEAIKEGFAINPRRIVQWENILKGGTIAETGSADFDAIPASVSSMLKYAFPLDNATIAGKWAEVSGSIVDSVGARIESYKGIAYSKFKQFADSTSASDRVARAGEMGLYLAECQKELKAMGGNDPRVNDAIVWLTGLFQNAITGKPL